MPDKEINKVGWRGIIIASILIFPNNYWIMQVEAVWNTGHSTCLSLMWHVVINLLVLILINVFLLKKLLPRYALTQGELIVVYAMLTLGASVCGRDMFQILTPVMAWAFWSLLHLSYKWGMSTIPIGHDSGVFNMLQGRLTNPTGMNAPAVIFMGIGLIFTFFLMLMRTMFLWWQLHPAGYALSMNFGIDYIWSCLVFSSIIKWFVLKYGGLGLHRKATMFFFGVILGEYCTGGFWSLMSVILQQRTYDFYHA